MKTFGRSQPWLQLARVLTVAVSMVVVTALPAAADVTLTPSSGPPGTRVTASGSSANPSAGGACKTVEVYFGATQHSDGHVVSKGTEVASGACDTAGNYSVAFTVPPKAAKGQTQVLVVGKTATGQTTREESAKFTVT